MQLKTVHYLFFSDDDFEKSEFILAMLINNPQDYELKEPPIMETMVNNFLCTFNRNIVSLEKVKADGNGAYNRKGGVTKCYFYNGITCTEAHSSDNGFFINVRSGQSQTWKKETVDKESIFFIKRYYRYNKFNDFNQLIVQVAIYNRQLLDYYYVLYRRNKDARNDFDNIIVGRHGNATNPHAGMYIL